MDGSPSRDEAQALLFIEDAKRFADILNVGATDIGQNIDRRRWTYRLLTSIF